MSVISPQSVSRAMAHLRDPLFRTGDLLILNAGLTALIGSLFWVGAAHRYSRIVVGQNSAAISAVMLIAGLGQLNLMSAMVRFVPVAGRGTRRLVVTAYVVSATVAGIFCVVFVLGARLWAPELAHLLDHSAIAVWFVVSTSLWCVFVLQDSVLTGLGRPGWVPLENAIFSIFKVLLAILLATLLPRHGLLVAWTVAVVIPTLPVNLFIFRRAIPQNVRSAPPTARAPSLGVVSRFLAGDYVTGLAWIAATALLPLLVLDRLGPASTASFSAAWVIGFALFTVAAAMGQSLVVRGAKDESELGLHSRRALVHALALLVPAIVVVLIAAPFILRIFGAVYAAEGSTSLRLLALAAIPNLFMAIAVSEMRVRRQMVRAAALMTTMAAIVLVLSYALLRPLGITGVGVAWLVGQGAVVGLLLVARHRRFEVTAAWRVGLADCPRGPLPIADGRET